MNDKEIQGMQIRICNACKQYKKCDKELCTMSELVAKELSRFYQPKITKNSVILTKEELNENYVWIDTFVQCKEELEFIKRQKNKLETRIAIKENDIGKLESEIDDLKYELKQSRKETVKNIIDEIKGQRLEIRIFTDKKRYIVEESFLDEILKRYD